MDLKLSGYNFASAGRYVRKRNSHESWLRIVGRGTQSNEMGYRICNGMTNSPGRFRIQNKITTGFLARLFYDALLPDPSTRKCYVAIRYSNNNFIEVFFGNFSNEFIESAILTYKYALFRRTSVNTGIVASESCRRIQREYRA